MPLNPTPAEIFPTEGLTSERVLLRRFVANDISAEYIGWLHDREVLRFSNQRFRRHDQVSARAYLDSFAGTGNLFLAICERVSGEHIGTMTVYASEPHATTDLGILLGARALWGQGLGREAWCLLVDWLLQAVHVRKVTAGCAIGNRGMVSLMEAANMHHEATRRAQEIIDGEPHDLVYYARFRNA